MTLADNIKPHQMRDDCPRCGGADGVITTVGLQDVVRCARCDRYCYNAPRTETGRPRRSLRSRPQIAPSQRHRVLVRDGRRCFVCGRMDATLEIGYILSVHDGRAHGLSDAELYHDENLMAICKECNSGQSTDTLPLWFLVAVLRVRIASTNREAS